MEGYEKLEYIGCDLKRDSKGRWLLLARFKAGSGHYDWAPKWAAELDKLYASAYLVELLNGGHTLKGFKQIYGMLNEDLIEVLKKAETEQLNEQEIERLRLNWKRVMDEAPLDVRGGNVIAVLRSAVVKPVAIEDDNVILACGYEFYKEYIEKPENRQAAERIISHFLGRSCHVRCIHKPEDNHLLRAALKTGAQVTSVEEK